MSREELREIVVTVIRRMGELARQEAPRPACIFSDNPHPCDTTTSYGINEEG